MTTVLITKVHYYAAFMETFCFCCSFLQRTSKDWAEAFDASGIPGGPINNIKQVFEDPQVNEFIFFFTKTFKML